MEDCVRHLLAFFPHQPGCARRSAEAETSKYGDNDNGWVQKNSCNIGS